MTATHSRVCASAVRPSNPRPRSWSQERERVRACQPWILGTMCALERSLRMVLLCSLPEQKEDHGWVGVKDVSSPGAGELRLESALSWCLLLP